MFPSNLNKGRTAVTLLLLVAMISSANMITYRKLAAQPQNQPQAAAAKAVAPTPQQSKETIQKEAERLTNLETAVVTPERRLKAVLDAAKVGEKMKSLLRARLDAANAVLRARWKDYCRGQCLLDNVVASSRRTLEAERELSTHWADQITAWESHLQRMEQLYVINLASYHAGRIEAEDLAQVDYYRLDAEIGLERAKARFKQSRESSE